MFCCFVAAVSGDVSAVSLIHEVLNCICHLVVEGENIKSDRLNTSNENLTNDSITLLLSTSLFELLVRGSLTISSMSNEFAFDQKIIDYCCVCLQRITSKADKQ